MAAIRGNTPRRNDKSIAEELMLLVTDEEYVELVEGLAETEYITKSEVTSIRKMISGKLWIDTRKFTSRQNKCIPTGMYEVFGNSISKSAVAVHAEVVQYFLEPEQKNLRDVLRKSTKNNKVSYSTWITGLNNINRPCDEYVLYLLCRCYNRHAAIVTSKRLLCTFKPGTMTTFEKLCKCDSVLIWLGEGTFAEIKPLQTPKGLGPLEEWQLAADCIQHLHEKNLAAKRPRKPVSNTASNIAITTNKTAPTTDKNNEPEKGIKRKRADIDYKQYHSVGTLSAKSPKSPRTSQKPLPKASGPSADRLAAQEFITKEKRGHVIGTAIKLENVKKEAVASNMFTRVSRKLVKEEPTIRMVHRKEALTGPERVIHPCGTLCKRSNKGGYYDDELPDLPSTPLQSTAGESILKSPPKASRQASRSESRVVATPITSVASLLSGFFPLTSSETRSVPTPSVATRKQEVNITSHANQPVSDVLSGYIPKTQSRIVTTASSQDTLSSVAQSTSVKQQLHLPSRVVTTPVRSSRSGTTPSSILCASEETVPRTETETKTTSTDHDTRVMQTNMPCTDTWESTQPDEMDLVDIQEESDRTIALHDLLDDPSPTRAVATLELQPPPNTSNIQNMTTTKNQDVYREPNVMEVAKTLLQLHGPDDTDITDENEQLLPVNAPRQADIVKEMAQSLGEALPDTGHDTLPDLNLDLEQDKNDKELDVDDDDDDATIIYEPRDTTTSESTQISSPKKGEVTFKHYGIKRRSPRVSNIRKHRCILCNGSFNSKKEMNNHHREKHPGVICPTCNKVCPTTDALQRHRYVHREPTEHKCTVCGKILPFDSDLKRHMKTHTEEKTWECPNTQCDRSFKRKADLDLHAVVHSGIKHKCTWPGCKYSNLDPRNVKRHQKSHTQQATVKCPGCERKFTFYMQMKRHRDKEH